MTPGAGVGLGGAASPVGGDVDFEFDAASAYLQVNAADADRSMLGVYDVYGILSGDMSLPYVIARPEAR